MTLFVAYQLRTLWRNEFRNAVLEDVPPPRSQADIHQIEERLQRYECGGAVTILFAQKMPEGE